MELRLLGDLEFLAGGTRVDLGPAKRRLLLAILAMHVGRVVSVDRLVDVLWDADPPRSAEATLQGLVYELRKRIGRETLVTRSHGYLLELPRRAIDVSRFEDALQEGVARREADPGGAADRIDAALSSWRGTPLAEFDGSSWAQAERTRLEGLRLDAIEMWCAIALELGRERAVAARLELEVVDHPLREGLWAALMLARYRCGRQADALRAYGSARRELGEQLGIEPGTELRRLEQAILQQDPALDRPRASDARERERMPRTRPLPSGRLTFVLTDVVGSTRLWERAPDLMLQALAHHENVIAGAVTEHGGRLIKARGEGDSTFSVFESAGEALTAALAAQRALAATTWPEDARIEVRMAVHVGPAVERDGDYYGPTVNCAARLRSLARAGEVLFSGAVAAETRVRLPPEAKIVDFGMQSLRDIATPEHVFALQHADLPAYPALQDAPTARAHVDAPEINTRLVGRAGERRHLARRFDENAAGDGSLVLLVGEPGIGKTSLATDLAAYAREHGGLVLWGRALDTEWAPPYAPVVEALERYVAQLAHADAIDLLEPVGEDLVRLLPCVQRLFPAIDAPPLLSSDEEPARLHRAINAILVRLARLAPVVVVLDDLHWADRSTVRMLDSIVRLAATERVLVLGTYRDTEVGAEGPLSDAITRVGRDVRVERIRLGGLGVASMIELVRDISGPQLAGDLVDAIVRETGGNPFFAAELTRAVLDGGGEADASASVDGPVQLPESVRATIEQRLGRLGEDDRLLLQVGSIFDDQFAVDVVMEVADLGVEAALDAVDTAIAAGLLEDGEQPDSYSFTHALIRTHLRDAISAARRVRLHRRAAVALESRHNGTRTEELAAEIAVHYFESAALPGAERGAMPALTTATSARAVSAHDQAARFFEIALALLAPSDPRRAEARAQLAMELVWNREPEAGLQLAEEVAAELALSGAERAAAEYLAEILSLCVAASVLTPLGLAEERIARAVDRYLVEHDELWARINGAELSRQWGLIPEGAYRTRAAFVARDDVRDVARVISENETLDLPTWALSAIVTDRADVLRLQREDPRLLVQYAGEYRSAIVQAERALVAASGRDQHRLRLRLTCILADCHIALGDLERARDLVARADAHYRQMPGPEGFAVRWQAQSRDLLCSALDAGWEELRAFFAIVERDAAAADELIAVDHRDVRADPQVIGNSARTTARLGRVDRALHHVERALECLTDALPQEPWFSGVAFDVTEALWFTNRVDHIETVDSVVRDKVCAPDFRSPMTDGRLARARLYALQGEHAEAVEWFTRARGVLDEQGARPLRAICDHDEALMYIRRGDVDDAARAAPLLDRAERQFGELGMTGWLDRVGALSSTAETAPA